MRRQDFLKWRERLPRGQDQCAAGELMTAFGQSCFDVAQRVQGQLTCFSGHLRNKVARLIGWQLLGRMVGLAELEIESLDQVHAVAVQDDRLFALKSDRYQRCPARVRAKS